MVGLVLGSASAEEPAKKEKSASTPPARKYEPLIIPGEQGASATPVPPVHQEIIKEQDKDFNSSASVETGSSGSRLVIPIEAEKEKKQQLWIYTLPEENAARKKDQDEEIRRLEQSENTQKSKQLPDWAIDPEHRKYFAADASEYSSDTIPGTDISTLDRGPFDLRKKPATDGEDPSAPYTSTRSSRLDEPARVTLPGGTSLTTARDASEVKKPGKLESGYLTKPEPAADKSADYNQLYESNNKEKKVEDFYDGLNKPVKVEKADDRYHKPQKPL